MEIIPCSPDHLGITAVANMTSWYQDDNVFWIFLVKFNEL